jgi:hypothetical protein
MNEVSKKHDLETTKRKTRKGWHPILLHQIVVYSDTSRYTKDAVLTGFYDFSTRTSHSTGYHFCFLFGRSQVQTPAWKQIMLRVFVVFLSSFSPPGQHLKLGHRDSFHIVPSSLIILSLDAIQSGLLTASLNETQTISLHQSKQTPGS